MTLEQPDWIGEWVRREQRGKVHLVESEIVNRLVMKCGRQMRLFSTGGELRVFGRFSRNAEIWCSQCGQP